MNRNKTKKHSLKWGDEQRTVHVAHTSKEKIFSDMYFDMLTMSWPKFFLYIGIVYFVINFIFGALYFFSGPLGLLGNHSDDNFKFFMECFFFSIQTFSTIGYGIIAPNSIFTNVIVSIQALVGMLSIGLSSGLFFSRFTRSTAKILFSDQILVTNHLDKRSIVIRLANSRINTVINAKVSMALVYDFIAADGHRMRIQKDLVLVRDFNSIFYLNWVVAHTLDDKSPLFGKNYEDLKNINGEIMVSFSGTDETFGQTIHAAKIYKADQFVYDRSFTDMIIREGDHLKVDLRLLSELK